MLKYSGARGEQFGKWEKDPWVMINGKDETLSNYGNCMNVGVAINVSESLFKCRPKGMTSYEGYADDGWVMVPTEKEMVTKVESGNWDC